MTKVEHALRLAAEGFWVFPIVAGKKTPPAVKGWQAWATRDPEKIRAHWAAHPDDNIGISTSKFGDDKALLVLDVDNKGSKRGDDELVRLELRDHDFPATREQRTPTGGRHLLFVVDEPVKQGSDVVASGLDVRSAGGYIVAAGSAVAGGAYEADNAPLSPAPAWLVEMCGRPRARSSADRARASVADLDAERAVKRATEYLLRDAPVADDPDAYKVACRVKDFGVDEATAIALMREHWDPRCDPPRSDNTVDPVRNAYRYGVEPVGAAAPEADFTPEVIPQDSAPEDNRRGHPFDELNKEFAFVIAGGGSHILWETEDAEGNASLEHLAVSAFHQKFAAHKIQVGKKSDPVTELWMEWKGRRSYDGLAFMPEQPCPPRFYNMWRGFAYEPWPDDVAVTKDAQWSLDAWREHVLENVCRGNEKLAGWLIGYFAHLVQRPWEKPLTALVFKGEKGVGKNAAVERVGALLGQHSMTTADRRYLVGNFNGHLENCLLFVLDEAFWSGDKQVEGILKSLVTSSHHTIEHKGKEQFKVANRTRIAILGNEEWIVPASHDERRYAVFDVGPGRKQDRAFFEAMRLKMEAGGYRLLLRFLRDPALLGGDVNAAPLTPALLEQKLSSLDPVHQWWFTCLLEGRIVASEFGGEWPRELESDALRRSFRRYFQERNIKSRAPDDRTIGRFLKQACAPMDKTKRSAAVGYVYVLPALADARAAWDDFIGHAQEWGE